MNSDCFESINIILHDTGYTSEPFSADPEPGDFHAVRDTAIPLNSKEVAMKLTLVWPTKNHVLHYPPPEAAVGT